MSLIQSMGPKLLIILFKYEAKTGKRITGRTEMERLLRGETETRQKCRCVRHSEREREREREVGVSFKPL